MATVAVPLPSHPPHGSEGGHGWCAAGWGGLLRGGSGVEAEVIPEVSEEGEECAQRPESASRICRALGNSVSVTTVPSQEVK
jgi:hypothetical protein